MDERSLHDCLVLGSFGLAVVTCVSLLWVTAPYGRHARAGWGPSIPSRIGWILMESPAVLAFTVIVALGQHRAELVPLVFTSLWLFHYVHRTFIFPFRMRSSGKRMPISIALLGMAFNGLNAYVNARWISHFGDYPAAWMADPRFLVGAALFLTGWAVNFHADSVLFRLRAPGQTGYQIPRGGLYRVVSCPNYLGEILEWTGWAIATWSLAGLSFAVYTTANLAPRAQSNHRWYRESFPDYPPERRALIPFVL